MQWVMQRDATQFRHSPCRLVLVGLACLLSFTSAWVTEARAWDPKNKAVANGQAPLTLLSDLLTESSGLSFSLVDNAYLWSHNDSGGKARLIAFGPNGRVSGRIFLRGVKATDWEDMCAYVDTVPRLLVADVGDNDARRSSVSLYLFDEPNPRRRSNIDSYVHLIVRYANGPQNCESVAVDVSNRRILLLGKSPLVATMYQVELPIRIDPKDAEEKVTTIETVATPIQTLAIPLATGMDFCPKTGDLWIANYLGAYRYPNQRKTSLEQRLKLVPEMWELPKLKQVEAIAVDDAGRVWVTSEGKPAKLQRIVHEKE